MPRAPRRRPPRAKTARQEAGRILFAPSISPKSPTTARPPRNRSAAEMRRSASSVRPSKRLFCIRPNLLQHRGQTWRSRPRTENAARSPPRPRWGGFIIFIPCGQCGAPVGLPSGIGDDGRPRTLPLFFFLRGGHVQIVEARSPRSQCPKMSDAAPPTGGQSYSRKPSSRLLCPLTNLLPGPLPGHCATFGRSRHLLFIGKDNIARLL